MPEILLLLYPVMKNKLSKFIGSLIGTAVGDSLGARMEGTPGFQPVHEIGQRYTDDTVMTLGVAESLIERRGYDYWDMTDRFVRNYEQEPWRRYGSGMPRIFRMMKSGRVGFGMLDRQIYPEGSFGNGAAMRVAPVGLFYYNDSRTLREIAYHTASITHSNELALEGAALQACAVALAVVTDPKNIRTREFVGALRMFTKPGPYQEKLKTIARLLDEKSGKVQVVKELGNGAEALNSVPTAIYAFLANLDFESSVTYAVSLGGDTDTIGAMCGAIAGACGGIENLPDRWKKRVENKETIELLATRLWEVKESLSAG
jgi:poly(ADP-ribose) glycohydrolase ARH3